MASPVDSARVATNISTAATSHAINVGSPVAGTLLVACIRFTTFPSTVTFTGWTQIFTDISDASDDTTEVWWRWADGTEGATNTLTTVNSLKLAAVCYKITGALNAAPSVSGVAFGTTANADPAAVNFTGGTQDMLFIAFAGMDSETATFTAPTGYGNIALANSGVGGAVPTNCMIATASRQATTTTSEDPPAFTSTAPNTGWTAITIAIKPSGPPPDPPVHYRQNSVYATAVRLASVR